MLSRSAQGKRRPFAITVALPAPTSYPGHLHLRSAEALGTRCPRGTSDLYKCVISRACQWLSWPAREGWKLSSWIGTAHVQKCSLIPRGQCDRNRSLEHSNVSERSPSSGKYRYMEARCFYSNFTVSICIFLLLKSPGEYEHTEVNKITVFYFVFFLTNLHRHTKQWRKPILHHILYLQSRQI
jgi:hypothetical protein